MALIVGQNSYISVADADEYFNTRLNSDAWLNADTATKEAALIQATRTIDVLYDWSGEKTSSDQPLDWPRSGVYDCDGNELDENTIPEAVENATCEEAIYLISGDPLTTPSLISQGFKRAKLGDMEIEVADSSSLILPDKIASMARDFLDCLGTPKKGASHSQGYTTTVIRN